MEELKTVLDFVVKVSERCNLACPYCYYYYQEFDNSALKRVIRRDVVARLREYINQGATELGIDRVNIALHGGEPLLVRKKYFDEICSTLRAAASEDVAVHLSLQTNGTLIDQEWIELFSKHSVRVGISIDGPPAHNDRVRPDKKGRGSFARTRRGLKLLQEAYHDGRIPGLGVLCVADPHLDGEELLSFFDQELGVRSLNLLMPRQGWGHGHETREELWRQFFAGVLNHWLPNIDSEVSNYNRLLSQILSGMTSDNGARLLDWQHSMRHHVVTVSSEGHVAPDDNLLGVDSSFGYDGKTIFNSNLRDLMNSRTWHVLIDSLDTVPAECAQCIWFRTCRSGELFNRHSSHSLSRRSVFCSTIDYIHERIASDLVRKGLQVDELSKRLGSPPQSAAADFRVDSLLARKRLRAEMTHQPTQS